MRTARCLSLALLIVFPCGRTYAQTTWLVGIARDSTYHTLWIRSDGASGTVLRDEPGIIIQRPDGLWRITSETHCTISFGMRDEPTSKQPFVNVSKTLVTQRIAAARKRDTSCREAANRLNRGARTWSDAQQCSLHFEELEFASPVMISKYVSDEETEFCSPAHYRTDVSYRVESWSGEIVELLSPLNETDAAAVLEALKKQDGDCEEPPNVNRWHIERDNGVWSAAVASACRSAEGDERFVSVPLPPTFVQSYPTELLLKAAGVALRRGEAVISAQRLAATEK